MKCTITLQVGGESIQVQVDSSHLPNSLAELKEVLGTEKWKVLVNKIDSTLKSRKKIAPPDLKKMKESGHVIPNTTMGSLINRFPDIAFPEDSDQYNISNKKVLFVDSYKTEKGELKYGMFLNKNGEEIFIIDRYNLDSVAKYLQTMKSLKSDHILRNVSPETMNELREIFSEVKKHISNLSSIEDMLISFLQTRNKYRDLTLLKDSNVISIYAYLDDFVGNLFKISHRRSYNDPTINNISHAITWNKSFDTASIGINQLFNFLSTELKQNISNVIGEELTIENFKEYFSGKINEQQLNNIFGKSEGNPYKILLDYLISKEPEFAMQFKEVKNDRIYMNTYFQTLENQYGIGFEQLLEQNEPTYYNGRYIQQIIDKNEISKYYVTKHYTTSNQRAKSFDTLQEAKNYIDNNLQEPIVENSFIEFHKKEQGENGELITDDNNSTKIKTKRKYPKGTLITLLDYDVPNVSLSMLTPSEAMFVSENYRNYDDKHSVATKEDFLSFIKEDLGFDDLSEGYNIIKNNINTPEKIALFILGINNPNIGNGKAFNKNSEKAILSLAKKIGSINKYKYFYVKNSNGTTTEIIPVNNDSVENTQTPPKRPVIQLWHAAQQVFIPKLGINMQILTEPEKGKENKKAYIKGNTVYINLQNADSQDLFHEYVHVLMAYLKNNPKYRDRYIELINTIWSLGENDLRREEIENSYFDYSMEDKMEEYFVDQFGKWIKNNANQNFSNIFSSSDIIKEGSSLFSSKTPITELYGSTIEQVFTKLNSDVSQFFKDNKPLMSSEYKNLFTVSRQKSEWIRQQIKNGKLIEYDCM